MNEVFCLAVFAWETLRELILDKLFQLNFVSNISVTWYIFLNVSVIHQMWEIVGVKVLNFYALKEQISIFKNNKWLKCKEWRPLLRTVWALWVTSVLCMLCLNRKCGSDAGWGWLIKHFVITNKCDDITGGGERRGRGWPRFPRFAGEKAFLASARRLESVSTSMENNHNNICHCHKMIYKKSRGDFITW